MTSQDIKRFVSESLHENEQFQLLTAEEPQNSLALIAETVGKADGVFLWVKLVVRSLLTGILNRDSIQELFLRLRSTPPEIEPLYEHLIRRIEPMYLQWTSKAFRIVQSMYQIKDVIVNETLTLRGFYFAICDDPDFENIHTVSLAWIHRKCEDTEVHIVTRCGGLLEHGRAEDREESEVRWFHQTARHFIENSIYGQGILQSSETGWTPELAMFKSTALEVVFQKRFHPESEDTVLPSLFQACLRYAQRSHNNSSSLPIQHKFLDQIKAGLLESWSCGQKWVRKFIHPLHYSERAPTGVDMNMAFLEIATEYTLTGYVQGKLFQRSLTDRHNMPRNC